MTSVIMIVIGMMIMLIKETKNLDNTDDEQNKIEKNSIKSRYRYGG